ncbi:MAG TPA: EAL domain-containing protein [Treponemataceae bacterium]|nr:EAL domain-containing protein [Treponemataceae bacterium]
MKYDKNSPIQIIQNLKKELSDSSIHVSELELVENILNRREAVYKTAFKSLHKVIWSYDFSTGVLHTTPSSRSYFAGETSIPNFLDDTVVLNLVHPDSIIDLKELKRQLISKSSQGRAEIRLPDKKGKEFWGLVSFQTCFNEKKEPLYAVFIGEDISEIRKTHLKYHENLDMLLTISEDIVMSAKVNITENKTEYFAKRSENMKNNAAGETVEQLATHLLAGVCDNEAKKKLESMFDQNFLLKCASYGGYDRPYNFKYTMPDGIIKWMEGVIRFLHQPSGWYVYYYLRDIDHLKRIEQDLEKQAKHDKLTGIYNRETALDLIKKLITKEHDKFFALFLFNIDNVTQLIRNDGYGAAEQVLVELSHLITMRLTGEKIIGRMNGFEIIVLVRGKRSHDKAKNYVKKIIADMNQKARFPDVFFKVSVSAGVCFADPKAKRSYTWYLQNTRLALDAAKKSGKNTYKEFGNQYTEVSKKEIDKSRKIIEDITSQKKNAFFDSHKIQTKNIEFTNWANQQFFRLPLNKALELILEKVCRYYNADRAFVHFAIPGTLELESSEMWQKESIRNISFPSEEEVKKIFKELLGMLQDGESLLCSSIEDIKKTHANVYSFLKSLQTNSCFNYPIPIDGEINGYLGIDNPRKNLQTLEVLISIATIVGLQKKINRLEKKVGYFQHYDVITGTRNRLSFTKYINNLNINTLSSLGIAVMSISNLKTLNNAFGRGRIDFLLRFISQTLCKYFEEISVYRRSGNEFIIVQKNIDFDAFETRLEKIQEEISVSYEDVFAIGSAWSDNEIDVDSLIFKADSILQINNQDKIKNVVFDDTGLIRDYFKQLKEEILKGQYSLYLQPKALFYDRSITSAEALVRHHDAEGKLVMPAMFISKLENIGLIHLIDFFILEEVCKFQETQKKRGRKVPAISLNFSRRTLVIKNLIDKMTEVTNKYDVERSNIEIEITESVGDVEQKTISALGKKIKEAGYRLSLDDFGSRFCNMAVLSSMELDGVKLDRSLVKDVYASERSRYVIGNFLNVCRQLSIVSIAEGVETEDQFKVLKDMGCDFAQGYLFNKAIPASEFEKIYL